MRKSKKSPTQQINLIQDYLSQDKKILYEEFAPLTNENFNHCNKVNRNILGSVFCNLKTPNILFIILESFRADDIGVYGGKVPLTSSFD